MMTTMLTLTKVAILLKFFVYQLSDSSNNDVRFNCKFPNEGCGENVECCSGKCVEAHPGTNARCTKLSLHKPCFYTYQCQHRLRCGKKNKCCAKYWGICKHAHDCCDPLHKCLEADGFYYKRCLYSNNLPQRGSQHECYNALTISASIVAILTSSLW